MGRATSLVLHLIRRRRKAAAGGAAVYRRLADPDQGGGSDATRPSSLQSRTDKRRRQDDDDAAAVALRRRRVKKKREAPDEVHNTRAQQTAATATGAEGAPGGVPEVESARLRCPMGHTLIRHTRGMAQCVGGRDCDVQGCGWPGLAAGDARFSCAACGFDACGLCEAKAGGGEESGCAARSIRSRTEVRPFEGG